MSNVLPSEGMKLQIESATPGTYSDIGGQLSIGGTKPTVEKIATTTLTSTRKTYRASLIPDEGEVTFKLLYDPNDTVHQAILTAFYAGTAKNWKLNYVDGQNVPAHEIFAAIITSFEGNDKEIETNVEVDVTLQITGTNARTAGAAS